MWESSSIISISIISIIANQIALLLKMRSQELGFNSIHIPGFATQMPGTMTWVWK